MSKNSRARYQAKLQLRGNTVPSLLAAMIDGKEYASIVDKVPSSGYDVLNDVSQALGDIEAIRGRPCVAYLGNVVRADTGGSSIDASDDLPFQEMIRQVPADHRKIDVLLATNGGSGQQVVRFVECLRNRFDEVDFLIPSFCMSAGTLWALSGDHIWMTPGAALGPIDPQIPSASGRYVPAQALLLLVEKLRQEGEAGLRNGTGVPWTSVRIIDTIDKKELGDAITATKYSSTMAAQFLERYKLRHWTVRESSQQAVTPEWRSQRARDVGDALASHDRWNNHGHSITRDVLWREIRLKIDHPDDQLLRAMSRVWALYNWIFDKTPVVKLMVSSDYRHVRTELKQGTPNA